MKDVENRAKEYDCLMQTIWEDLELATNNPEQKQRRIDPDDMKNYREALEFLSEHDPGGDWKEYDFSFLERPAEDLSKEKLWCWEVYIMSVRAGLKEVIEGSDEGR